MSNKDKSYDYNEGYTFAISVLNGLASADEHVGEWSKDFTMGYLDGTAWWCQNLKADVGRITSELRDAIRELQARSREIDKDESYALPYHYYNHSFDNRILQNQLDSLEEDAKEASIPDLGGKK